MDIKTLFPNLIGTWVRWSDYEIKPVNHTPYIVPVQHAVELPYSYADQTNELVVDGLNLGKQLYQDNFCENYYDTVLLNDARERQKTARCERACMDFARKYGLLGLTKPADVHPLFQGGSPMRYHPSSKEYGEEITRFGSEFLSLYLHFLSTRKELPAQLDEFRQRRLADIAETPIPSGLNYHLTTGNPPQLVWKPDSLQSILRLAYSLAVTDPVQPIKVCKNCGTIYHNPHQKSEFCSVRCRNYYNVQVFRGKGKAE